MAWFRCFIFCSVTGLITEEQTNMQHGRQLKHNSNQSRTQMSFINFILIGHVRPFLIWSVVVAFWLEQWMTSCYFELCKVSWFLGATIYVH